MSDNLEFKKQLIGHEQEIADLMERLCADAYGRFSYEWAKREVCIKAGFIVVNCVAYYAVSKLLRKKFPVKFTADIADYL